jgi:outer membrane lipoprotein-sorting protein
VKHRKTKERIAAIFLMMFIGCFFTACMQAESGVIAKQGDKVTAPPESVVEKYDLDAFYKKYLDANGIAITSSEKVADEALYEVRYLISKALAHRPDIWQSMAEGGTRIIIISAEEEVSQIPEYYIEDEEKAAYQNRRVRGYGTPALTSCGEENLLNYSGDRYTGENIFLHEFAHCIDSHLNGIDSSFRKKLNALYEDARKRGLWENTYAASNAAEYWAEGVQDWWDCNKEGRGGEVDGIHNHVNTREELQEYDPNLAALIEETLGKDQWRYSRYIDRNKEYVKEHKSKYEAEAVAGSDKKNPASDYLQRLSAKTRQLESYQCKIDYLFEQPLFESKSLRKGKLYYQEQKDKSLLRINFETLKEDDGAPRDYKDEYIFDGRWLTHIDYQTEQVKRYEQAEEGEQIDAFELVRQSFPIIGFTKVEELEQDFEIKFIEQKSTKAGDFVQLNLKPKPESQYAEDYVSIDFWIDIQIDLPSKIAAVNTEKDIYTIEFVKAVINKAIDKKVFEYKIPEDFTVEIDKLGDEK